jgi:hypothetical protein
MELRELAWYKRAMDPQTFVIALLGIAVFGLAIVVGLAHRDMARAVDRMDGAVNRMDRSASACERAADSCLRLAEQVRDLVVTVTRSRPGEPAE